jgi:hypothetical protein
VRRTEKSESKPKKQKRKEKEKLHHLLITAKRLIPEKK